MAIVEWRKVIPTYTVVYDCDVGRYHIPLCMYVYMYVGYCLATKFLSLNNTKWNGGDNGWWQQVAGGNIQ